jgi:hypothetical protein
MPYGLGRPAVQTNLTGVGSPAFGTSLKQRGRMLAGSDATRFAT